MEPSARERELKEALAVYVGSLAVDARVVLFGDASLGIAERLLEAGARVVYVWDPDPERARAAAERASRGVYVQAYPPREAVRTAELVLVPDLGLFDDTRETVARARQVAGESGIALIRALNSETAPSEAARAFDYYDLFELVAGSFSSVRMVAELAFEGVALVVLGEELDDAPAVSVDTQLAEGDRPVAAFVAVAGECEIGLDPYAIIELRKAAGDGAVSGWAIALAEAQAVAEGLEARLQEQTARCAELESELAVQAGRLSSLLAEVDELRRELASSDEARAAEVLQLESALRERAQALRSLEAELARRDEIVRDLVSSLDEGGAFERSIVPEVAASSASTPVDAARNPTGDVDENARLRRKLDALATDLARREADAHATGWTVAELERRLAELERELAERDGPLAQPKPSPPQGAALSPMLDEVDALRRALAQEHEGRVRVESGAALAQARSDIERLTVLLEQLAARERGPLGAKAAAVGEPAPPVP